MHSGTAKHYSRRVEGLVVIPYNFTISRYGSRASLVFGPFPTIFVIMHRLVAFLNQHLPDIKKERENIRQEAHLIADLSHRLQKCLGLTGTLSLSCAFSPPHSSFPFQIYLSWDPRETLCPVYNAWIACSRPSYPINSTSRP